MGPSSVSSIDNTYNDTSFGVGPCSEISLLFGRKTTTISLLGVLGKDTRKSNSSFKEAKMPP